MPRIETSLPQQVAAGVAPLLQYPVFACGVALLGLLCVAWSPVALVLGALLPPARAHAVGRVAITRAFRFYVQALAAIGACRFDLGALDDLRAAGPLIIAPNHPSLIDAVLVISRLPVTCVMKAGIHDNVFLGPGSRLAGYIGNRSVRRMIGDSVKALAAGSQLLFFPEGTRSTRYPVNRFNASIGSIARHAGVPVQTVFIDTDSPYLAKGWPLLRKPPLPITYRIRLGQRFEVGGDTRAFVAMLEAYYAKELERPTLLATWLPADGRTADAGPQG
jgi:1-acyl-sn-glycerol-3-phosphate acyltransferase